MKRNRVQLKFVIFIIFIIIVLSSTSFAAQEVTLPKIGINIDTANTPQDTVASIQILLLLTVLSLAPSILIMMTSFTRTIIVLSFLRNALGTQQMPPNQVLVGLALFLTLFVMTPVITNIGEKAYTPYSNGEITQKQGLEITSDIMKEFMLKQTNKKDLGLFISLSGINTPIKEEDVYKLPITTVIPSFIISEITTAFKIGFLIYIPFLIIDMVVASTLMAMGMMMLPPVMISLPFKIILFIMVGGWNLVSQMIINSFA